MDKETNTCLGCGMEICFNCQDVFHHIDIKTKELVLSYTDTIKRRPLTSSKDIVR